MNNRILLSLSKETLQKLLPEFEPLNLRQGHVLDGVDAPLKRLYFVERGLVSLVKSLQDGRTIEIGAIGIEGIVDPFGIFDTDEAFLESMVQIPGSALCISRESLRMQLRSNPELLAMMHRYIAVAMNQIAQTAACNGLHGLEERCCRWLLIAHDSALADTFPLTHEFLAMMLGVQRASVSLTANILYRAGLIQYTRGQVTITDRPGLENAACECYGTIRVQLDKVLRVAER